MISNQTTRHPATWQITDGMTVFGAGGDKLGTVRNYDPQASYLDIQKGVLFNKNFYLGWGTIAAVTADGITLRLNKKDLHGGLFASPPPGSIAYNAGLSVAEED
jgi:hypothetical protein